MSTVIRNCTHCGYRWEQRLDAHRKPRQCPYCKSPKWDERKAKEPEPVEESAQEPAQPTDKDLSAGTQEKPPLQSLATA